MNIIIYINNISKASNLLKFIVYADDTSLSTTMEIVICEIINGDIEAVINRELDFINDWLKSNKLSLNINKSTYMVFYIPHKKVNPKQLHIENTIVGRVYVFNFLGMTINENLNWKSYR